jgi:hypothetical protein
MIALLNSLIICTGGFALTEILQIIQAARRATNGDNCCNLIKSNHTLLLVLA